ncbi:AbrB family transcriptional regulator [Oceanicella sp. SM1341]|uniref:AbrB family transcriptional regulator n=1 Tax=Oceanicella sp. SM1341 TaxID=1548889 RepID=UPI000E4784F8|nr:AbrB family transcriptional regulator [Oceanicella sp. SM1341]
MACSDTSPAPQGRLARQPLPAQFLLLVLLSVVMVALLELLRLPAALLLGPMVAAIILASAEVRVRVPRLPFQLAQAVIGCMIARVITPATLAEVAADWPIFLAGVLSVVAASALLGWLLARAQVLPGTTAVWGSSPGAAAAMVFMAEAHGADVRLVAFMQYVRVVLVAVAASAVARIWVGAGGGAPAPVWFPETDWAGLAMTLALAWGCVGLSMALRFRSGPFLLPLVLGVALEGAGLIRIELPLWLLALSYAMVGWSIGLRFTRSILRHAMRALPRLVASILLLMAICGAFAAALVAFAGVDPLTAYLATSPGGADSVAIIAASSDVDVSFVMAMQTSRFLVVLVTGPALARLIARLVRRRLAGGTP